MKCLFEMLFDNARLFGSAVFFELLQLVSGFRWITMRIMKIYLALMVL